MPFLCGRRHRLPPRAGAEAGAYRVHLADLAAASLRLPARPTPPPKEKRAPRRGFAGARGGNGKATVSWEPWSRLKMRTGLRAVADRLHVGLGEPPGLQWGAGSAGDVMLGRASCISREPHLGAGVHGSLSPPVPRGSVILQWRQIMWEDFFLSF